MRKFTFTSKFNKFNCSCIYDLVEEKDLAEFSSLLSKIEANNAQLDGQSLSHLFSDIKIYIRFNWYSFNDLNMVNPTVPFSMQTSGANIYLPQMTKPSQLQLSKPFVFSGPGHQHSQQPNYPFVRHPGETGTTTTGGTTTSSSTLIYLGSSIGQVGKLPNQNNTMSTHSSSSTVYNQPTTSTSIQSLNTKQRPSKPLKKKKNCIPTLRKKFLF